MTLKTKTNLVISLLIVILALPVAALADLKVAIDDGTWDSELFVYLDELPLAPGAFDARDSLAIASAPFRCEVTTGEYQLRRSVAITSERDFYLGRGVTIISDDAIDKDTRDQIRSLLVEAGHDEDVVFVDGSTRPDAVKSSAIEAGASDSISH